MDQLCMTTEVSNVTRKTTYIKDLGFTKTIKQVKNLKLHVRQYQLPPQLPSVFRENPPPPLKLNLNGNYPYYPNYLQLLKRPHPHSVFILCTWYTILVSILIKSIVLSLFLSFITLSDLYYLHHPPSEGCTFRSKKKAFYAQVNGWLYFFFLIYLLLT